MTTRGQNFEQQMYELLAKALSPNLFGHDLNIDISRLSKYQINSEASIKHNLAVI